MLHLSSNFKAFNHGAKMVSQFSGTCMVLAIPVFVLPTFKSLSTTVAQSQREREWNNTTERDIALCDRMNSHSILFVE